MEKWFIDDIENVYKNCKWPCLTEESCAYVCNALLDASQDDDILCLEGL